MLKKFAGFIIVLMAAGFSLHAQIAFTAGINGTNQYSLGSLRDYSAWNAGGGFTAEYGIPLSFFKDFGVSAHVQETAFYPAAGSSIHTWLGTAVMAGAWANFKLSFLKLEGLSVQPEVCYGAVFHYIDSSSAESFLKGVYTDQIVQVAGGVRYVLPITKFPLIVEAAPLYTFIPEQNITMNMLGFRLSALYTFNMSGSSAGKKTAAAKKTAK